MDLLLGETPGNTHRRRVHETPVHRQQAGWWQLCSGTVGRVEIMGIDYTACLMIATSKGGDSGATGGAGRD